MTLPWVARSLHEALMSLLGSQVAELKAERTILLDRLASLGLGGPLFTTAPSAAEDNEDAPDESGDMEQLLMSWRRRPSRLADALTSQARRERLRATETTRVQWVPQGDTVSAMLDQAEAAGKIQA